MLVEEEGRGIHRRRRRYDRGAASRQSGDGYWIRWGLNLQLLIATITQQGAGDEKLTVDEFDESGTISSKKDGGYFRAKIGNTSFFFLPLLLIVATEFKGGGQGEFGKVKRHAWCRLAIR